MFNVNWSYRPKKEIRTIDFTDDVASAHVSSRELLLEHELGDFAGFLYQLLHDYQVKRQFSITSFLHLSLLTTAVHNGDSPSYRFCHTTSLFLL